MSLAAPAVLVGAVVALYSWTLHAPFVFDDIPCIKNNPSITHLSPLWGNAPGEGPLRPPKDFNTAGRPLVNLSLALNVYFGGLNPFGFHVFNAAIHLLSALLLWGIVRRTLRLPCLADRFADVADALALAVALLWLVHPLQTEAVQYVSQRTELLMAFFYLATLYASLRYFTANVAFERIVWASLATVACAAGMTSKEVMVSAPIVVLLFEWTFLAGSFAQAWRRSWPLYVALAGSWSVLWALNASGPRSVSAGFHLGTPAYVWWFTQAKVLAMYLKLAVVPWPLVIHYEIPRLDTFVAAWPWLVPVGLLGLGTLWLLWRRSAVGFLAAVVFLVLSPTLVVPIITEVAAERRMYLPLAALIAMLVCGGYALAARAQGASSTAEGHERDWPLVPTVGGALVLVVVLFGSLSVRRLLVYQNELALWQDTFARQPNNPVARNNLATTLINLGNDLGTEHKHEQALAYYRKASEVRPDDVLGHLGVANSLYCLNRLDEADDPLSRAAACHPNDGDRCKIDVLLGMVRIAQRRPGEAIEPLRRALAIDSSDPVTLYLYGMALARQGDTAQGVEKLLESIQIRSDLPIAHYELGRALFSLGKPEQAVVHFRKAVELSPNEANYRQDFAAALSRVGNMADAENQLLKAIQLNPRSANAHNLLGVVYVHKGNSAAAIAQFKTALEIMPTHQDALKNIAKVQQQDRAPPRPTQRAVGD
ncbi:MAG TPA: tetratricopeptide repeat protein [Pirellulales bacterium]|nr:tetratricopeptide repeat protein [Pirellulales bacterium]